MKQRILALCLLMIPWWNPYAETMLNQWGIESIDRIELKMAPLIRKKKTLYLPLRPVLFESNKNLHRLKKEIEIFNEIYANCKIQIKSPIQVSIYKSHRLPLSFTSQANYLPWDNPEQGPQTQKAWGQLARKHFQFGIPVLYLNESHNRPGLIGASRNFRMTRPRQKAIIKEHAPFAVYLTDIARKQITKKRSFKMNLYTLSHELGHILFNEGHHGDHDNIMAAGNVRKAHGITKKQCRKARRFVMQYKKLIEQY